ncbi:MAG TPA: hypothetical protein VIJ93_12330, partial [bacterium]
MAAIFLRFHHLVSLLGWPRVDDGLSGFTALELSQAWDWKLFHQFGQDPPAFLWGMAVLYKFLTPSLLALWLYPALLSLGTIFTLYWACRQFFSINFSIVAVVIFGINFWPAYAGRFCQVGVLVVFWQGIAFGLLGLYLRQRLVRWAFLLGAITSLGLYTAPYWIPTAVLLIVTVIFVYLRDSPLLKNRNALFAFLFSSALTATPLCVAVLKGEFGKYLWQLWTTPSPAGWVQGLQTPLSYGTGLFWGPLTGSEYGPEWGGFLNPVISTFFLIGVVKLLKSWSQPSVRWLGVGFFFLFISSLLAKTFIEYFRLIHLIPFVALFA